MFYPASRHPRSLCFAAFLFAASGLAAAADDWPMWRYDAGRTAVAPIVLPDELHLQWVRQLAPLKPAYQNPRLQFDAGYEPVVLGKTLFVGSSRNDSVTALDTDTGAERWRLYTDAPVRVAPVAWRDRVFFGSDDGHLYCVSADQGTLLWKFRAVPGDRKLLGNGRLISVWPIRGGPVLADGKLYFAAGVLPAEGIFLYALDAESGQVVWQNDRTGYLYGTHPHAAEALGGLTPQGYLAVDRGDLIVPCGTALPARVDLNTGELKSFSLPKDGRYPGGWFTAAAQPQRRGEADSAKDAAKISLVYDSQVNRDRHEGGWHTGPGTAGDMSRMTAGEKTWNFGDGFPGVRGTIHSMLAADGKLFVVTREGELYAFGGHRAEVKSHALAQARIEPQTDAAATAAEQVLLATQQRDGYALVCGLEDGRLVEELVRQSRLTVIAVDADQARVQRLRRRWDEAGWYGTRIAAWVGQPERFAFPPYLASLVVSERPLDAAADCSQYVRRVFPSLRPYGGTACLRLPTPEREKLAAAVRDAGWPQAQGNTAGELALLRRNGALPGAVNYTGGWSSPDERVRAPLGVLWFDDSIGHFKRAPQPKYIDGVMISHDKAWRGWLDGDRPPYRLVGTNYMDVYTGRVLTAEEATARLGTLPLEDLTAKQPEQYRPPAQTNVWSPPPPVIGQRTNPLTGRVEPRAFPKSYGCDGGNDYGFLYTLRSGTAAFYDKRTESGTVHISGPRSGCTNSIIPANGLLNVPYFYQGCTCSYPLPVGLAMVSMPESYEQWTAWGTGTGGPIQRIGINLGAPGDRITNAGTLWLDVPSVGGPSPAVSVTLEPESAQLFYQHSLRIEGGQGWPWVVASHATGLSALAVQGLQPGEFLVRLYFAEPAPIDAGERVFDVSLQGQPVLEAFDIAAAAGGPLRGVVREFRAAASDGQLRVEFQASVGEPLLCGLEMVAAGLTPGEVPSVVQGDGGSTWQTEPMP
jgi:hypothetical protein